MPPRPIGHSLKAKPARKNKYLVSTFDLTLNTNRSQPEYEQIVISLMNEILNNMAHFLKYASYYGSKDADWLNKVYATKVHTFNVEQATGTEARNNGWHVHSLVGVIHNTRVHIDNGKIKQWLKKKLGYSPYFRNLFKSDERTVIEMYHRKGGGGNQFVPTAPTMTAAGPKVAAPEAKLKLCPIGLPLPR